MPDLLPENLKMIIEVLIIFIALFAVYRFIRGTGGGGVLHGMVIIFTIVMLTLFLLADTLHLYRIQLILRGFLQVVALAVLIVFQPELRRGLIRLSQSRWFGRFFGTDIERTVNTLATAVAHLSREKRGALIVLEKGVGLQGYIDSGTTIDAKLSTELLDTVFFEGTALHDGGVIVRGDRLVAANCFFPLTDNPNVSRRIGTRHRAAIGISEESDALALIVSEETGLVSIAHMGKLDRGFDRDALIKRLEEFYREAAEIKAETVGP